MKANFSVMNTSEVVVKIRPEKIQACMGFEPMTSVIVVQCSALPTELTSQLGAGHYVGSKWTCEVMNKWLWIYENNILVRELIFLYIYGHLFEFC